MNSKVDKEWTYETFTRQLSIGHYAEDIVEDYLKDKEIKNKRNHDNRWDFQLENGKRIEVKFDIKSKETGNLAIEVTQKGKPSGLTTTESDYYLFITGNLEAYKIGTPLLREITSGYKIYPIAENNTGYLLNIKKQVLNGNLKLSEELTGYLEKCATMNPERGNS
jgi:hypothetical protein